MKHEHFYTGLKAGKQTIITQEIFDNLTKSLLKLKGMEALIFMPEGQCIKILRIRKDILIFAINFINNPFGKNNIKVRDSIKTFATKMETIANEDDLHFPEEKRESVPFLAERVKHLANELSELINTDSNDILKKCIDIANYARLITDRLIHKE